MSQRELKEAFVSNLNGTSLEEVALGTFLAPVCLINRGLVWILYHQWKRTSLLPFPWTSHFFLDFSVVIVPLVLSCTILSDILHQVIVGLALISMSMLFYISSTCSCSPNVRSQNSIKSFLQSNVLCDQVPFVTVFRVLVNVKTAISILAVDFSVFPRRYAKTETYGTGVMDFGVGAYVFANALVCTEARRKNLSCSRMNNVTKQVMSVWPLAVLGIGRLICVKLSGYQEHVTEYGVHWNFFFTLAIVRVVASLLLTLFPVSRSGLCALLIGALYQFALETSGLKSFIIHDDDRTKDFLHANREGIFSVVGYIAIYMAGVQVGLYVMQPRTRVREWLGVVVRLLVRSCTLYTAVYVCQTMVEPVSRRLANLAFCLWTVAQSLFFLSCLGAADVVLLFFKGKSGCRSVPSSWNLCKKEKDSDEMSVEGHCLVQAINRNQLLFFILANVMTGVTNMLVDTVGASDRFSVCVLLSYMFVNCCVIQVLHIFGITVKFW